MDLVGLVYRSTKSFPPEELYGLASQMRRATIAVVGNRSSAEQTAQEIQQAIEVAAADWTAWLG